MFFLVVMIVYISWNLYIPKEFFEIAWDYFKFHPVRFYFNPFAVLQHINVIVERSCETEEEQCRRIAKEKHDAEIEESEYMR